MRANFVSSILLAMVRDRHYDQHRAVFESNAGANLFEKRAMAWPENASCAAGLLSREWHEGTGASHTLQPNPRRANSRLLDKDHSLARRSSKGEQSLVLTLGFIFTTEWC